MKQKHIILLIVTTAIILIPIFFLFRVPVSPAENLSIFPENSGLPTPPQLQFVGDENAFSNISFPPLPDSSPTPIPTLTLLEFPLSDLQVSPALSSGVNPTYDFDSITLPSPTLVPNANTLTYPGENTLFRF